ncbi:MAG: hypothetical protein K2K36_08555 [Muribaculaceae bacterium]|nr:hypothetical protein [Muribaculaceae bacterium]
MKFRSARKDLFTAAALITAILSPCAASAQSYYDDDIYYDASKAPKPQKQTQKKAVPAGNQTAGNGQFYYDGAAYVPWNNVGDFQSADTYQPTGTSTRDVDEYNRRYSTPSSATAQQPDSITLQQFEEMGSNTRNLARFHGSQVAADAYTDNAVDDPNYYVNPDGSTYGASNDYYYTSAQPSTTLNINVVGGNPWYWGSPWYGGYYSPWYGGWAYDPWYWGPSYSWNWGWGPAWSWGPSWAWGWGGPAWGPGWGDPHHPSWGGNYRPTYTSSGAFAPNATRRPSGNSNYRGTSAGSTYNRGSYNSSNGYRPSSGTAGNRGSAATSRPGYRAPIGTPSTGNATQQGSNGFRGYTSPNGNNTYRPQNTNNSTNNSYRPSNSGSYRPSGSGSYGGSRGGGYSGGASRGSSGGGGHRGR